MTQTSTFSLPTEKERYTPNLSVVFVPLCVHACLLLSVHSSHSAVTSTRHLGRHSYCYTKVLLLISVLFVLSCVSVVVFCPCILHSSSSITSSRHSGRPSYSYTKVLPLITLLVLLCVSGSLVFCPCIPHTPPSLLPVIQVVTRTVTWMSSPWSSLWPFFFGGAARSAQSKGSTV